MSLVGSLEDLGLGDILQIISLSQKSGVLLLRSEEGEGSILFRDGLVRAAHLKDGVQTLRALLVDGGFVAADAYDAVASRAEADGLGLEEALCEDADISSERIDSLRRENVEAAVVRMFGWRSGEFSFEVGNGVDGVDSDLLLPTGINAQYLAMEGARIGDEGEEEVEAADALGDSHFADAADAADVAFEPDTAREEPAPAEWVDAVDDEEPVFSGEEVSAADSPAGSPLEPAPEPVVEPVLEGPASPATSRSPHEPASPATSRSPHEPASPATSRSPQETVSLGSMPLVVVDPDLHALEWVKRGLENTVSRIHIFQVAEQGLVRVRQYLTRGVMPLVLVSPDLPGDPMAGIDDATALVRRMKAHAPRMHVFWLDSREEPARDAAPADAVLVRPPSYEFSDPRAAARLEAAERTLRDALGAAVERARSQSAPPARMSAEALRQLREVTDKLSDASNRGEVLPLVIDFAARSFSRVAMFMLRDGEALAMAQTGLPRAGGPDDKELPDVRLPAREPGLFARVLDGGQPVRGALSDAGDRRLAEMLGDATPGEAYVAPIQTGGEVVALLYADNLPGSAPLADASALEVALHHAGLALDRAVLERALAEAEERAGR